MINIKSKFYIDEEARFIQKMLQFFTINPEYYSTGSRELYELLYWKGYSDEEIIDFFENKDFMSEEEKLEYC